MNRFAALLDRLAYEPSRNGKLRLMTEYFRETPDPERGYALAALTGALSFRHAKPGIIRALIAERVDPVLFGLSHDYVGDLSETVALMWPEPAPRAPIPPPHREGGSFPSLPSPACGGELGWGEPGGVNVDAKEPHPAGPSRRPPSPYRGGSREAPRLSEVVERLATLGKAE